MTKIKKIIMATMILFHDNNNNKGVSRVGSYVSLNHMRNNYYCLAMDRLYCVSVQPRRHHRQIPCFNRRGSMAMLIKEDGGTNNDADDPSGGYALVLCHGLPEFMEIIILLQEVET